MRKDDVDVEDSIWKWLAPSMEEYQELCGILYLQEPGRWNPELRQSSLGLEDFMVSRIRSGEG